MRDPDALKTWMDERQAAGIVGFHTSLAGCGKIHDRWNGRAGDFDYQISILKMAAERGMVRQERLFMTQNTLPLFDQLLDIMEGIPGEARPYGHTATSMPGSPDDTKTNASPRTSATLPPPAHRTACGVVGSRIGARNAIGFDSDGDRRPAAKDRV